MSGRGTVRPALRPGASVRTSWGDVDLPLVGSALALSVVGMLLVWSATHEAAGTASLARHLLNTAIGIALALRWMWDPESPFHLKPRASAELLDWAWKFWRACTQEHVVSAAPLQGPNTSTILAPADLPPGDADNDLEGLGIGDDDDIIGQILRGATSVLHQARR